MIKSDFDTGILQVQQVYGKEYNNQHMLNKLENMTRYWSVGDWKRVLERLFETRERQPMIPNFMKAYSEVRDTRGKSDIEKVHDSCHVCEGEGVLISIEQSGRAFPGKDYAGVVLCSCRNTENWDKVIPKQRDVKVERLCTVKQAVMEDYSPSELGSMISAVKDEKMPDERSVDVLEGTEDMDQYDDWSIDDSDIPF